MYKRLIEDLALTDQLLNNVVKEANSFLSQLNSMPAGVVIPENLPSIELSDEGIGALSTLEYFKDHYSSWISGSAGPRYYGLVTGGVTPAALAGDWLVSVYDQNNVGSDESIAPRIELDTIGLMRQLFNLPNDFAGSFVTGATMSNFVGLALGRQWIGNQLGTDLAKNGLWGLEPVKVFSGTPHSSVYKALSMLGMGRSSLINIPCIPDREAMDVSRLEQYLISQNGKPCIIVANAGTVNTVDFDDLLAITELRKRHHFWMHVDAAFGGFAACSPKFSWLVNGMGLADSITIDAHKWLNVPYDAAMIFTPHQELQAEVFQNTAMYLDQTISNDNFVNLTPENSRRLRALPSWFSLIAYGKLGYTEIVERNCLLAQWLGEQIETSSVFELLAPVRMNGVCFSFSGRAGKLSNEVVKSYLKRLQRNGGVFLTSTVYKEKPAIRASITNWRTTRADVETAWKEMMKETKEYV